MNSDGFVSAVEIPLEPEQDAWPDPIPFSEARDLPLFPVFALPYPLQAIVAEIAESVMIDPIVPGLLSLTVGVATGAGRFRVQVGDTHSEPMCLWTTSIEDSGGRKTAAFSEMVHPIYEWEHEFQTANQGAWEAHEQEAAAVDERLKALRSAFAKSKDGPARDQIATEIRELCRSRPEPPVSGQLVSQDATPEALALAMSRQGGRSLVISDEGGIFGLLQGRYSQNGPPNLDVYLQGHAGSPIKVERIIREANVIPRPALSMAFTVQPWIIESIGANPRLRGTGLTPRFLFGFARSLVGTRLYTGRCIDQIARASYSTTIKAALGAAAERLAIEPAVIAIRGEALRAWASFHDKIERLMADGGPYEGLRDWGSKSPGALARISAGFEIVADPFGAARGLVSAENVERAAAILEALAPHAIAALNMMSCDHRIAKAIRILGWIRRTGAPGFSLRDLHQQFRTPQPDDLREYLALLEGRGFIRPAPPEVRLPGRGGRAKSPRWNVHPSLVRQPEPSAHNPQNSHNERPIPGSVNCGDSVKGSSSAASDPECASPPGNCHVAEDPSHG